MIQGQLSDARLKIWELLDYPAILMTKERRSMTIGFKKPTEEELKIYFNHEWTHYVASVHPPRPGFAIFAATLEYQFFVPGTPENADFKILSTGWHHDSVWMTVSIPTAKKHLAEAVAKYSGLRILDTFPIACVEHPAFATIGMEVFEQLKSSTLKWEAFPLYQCTNMFSLENSDEHPIRNGKMTHSEWNEYELEVVGKITGKHEWTEEEKKELEKFREFMKSN